MSASTGAHTIWCYRWEDDGEYNQNPSNISDDTNKIFGADETMETADRSNNPERMMRPFQRHSEQILEMEFDGSWQADFVLTNTWWLQFFYGAPTSSGSSVPYTHDYSTDPTSPPKSAQLIEETHHSDGTITQTIYTGVVAGSIDTDVSVQDTANITIDGLYADEETYDTDVANNSPFGTIGSQPDTSYRAMHFGNSILKMDVDEDDTHETLAHVQDAGLSLEGNVELGYELGTRFPVIPEFLNFEPSINYTTLIDGGNAMSERKQMYGASSGSEPYTPAETMSDAEIVGALEFDANTGTDNKLVFNLKGAFPEDYSRSNIGNPEDPLEDDITRMINNVTVTVTSDTETPP